MKNKNQNQNENWNRKRKWKRKIEMKMDRNQKSKHETNEKMKSVESTHIARTVGRCCGKKKKKKEKKKNQFFFVCQQHHYQTKILRSQRSKGKVEPSVGNDEVVSCGRGRGQKERKMKKKKKEERRRESTRLRTWRRSFRAPCPGGQRCTGQTSGVRTSRPRWGSGGARAAAAPPWPPPSTPRPKWGTVAGDSRRLCKAWWRACAFRSHRSSTARSCCRSHLWTKRQWNQ